MKKELSKCLLIIVALFIQFNVLVQADQVINNAQTIAPDSHIQDQINYIVSAENKEKTLSGISKLKEMGSKDIGYLTQQLIYFRVNTMKMYHMKKITSGEMQQAMNLALIILSKLVTLDENPEKLPSAAAQSMINAVVPYLGTKDPELRKQLHWLLKKIDFRGTITPYYSEYETYIERNTDNSPQELIQYMYEKSPEEALLALTRVYMKKPEEIESIVQTEQTVSADIKKREFGSVEESLKVGLEAKKALDELSKYNQWWVRLYVAEIIGREPALRTPEILERLKKDTNPLVHETLNRFQKEKK